MTPSQQLAVDSIKSWITKNRNTSEDYGDKITQFDVRDGGHYVWVTVQTDMVLLPETNLLRVLSSEFWLIKVGKRGKVEAVTYPSCYKQFKGTKAFDIFFN